MPESEYYGGHGKKVMASMRKEYGGRAERVFYATANKKRMNPRSKSKKRHKAFAD